MISTEPAYDVSKPINPSQKSSTRKLPKTQRQHWASIKESGTLTGLRFLFAAYRVLGRRVFKSILIFVSLYFVVARAQQRRSSRDYLKTHALFFPSAWKNKPGWRHTVIHFWHFGEAILDKAVAWSQRIDENQFSIVNQQGVEDILNDERGQLIIGTHFGNLEYCRGFMVNNKEKIINILIYDRHAINFATVMERISPASRLNIFQVDELDIDLILKLKTKVDSGEWLFIAGDRSPVKGTTNTVPVSFLGRTASFPIGPYLLARTLGCPVKLMFAYRQKNKVIFDLVPFADKIERSGRDRHKSTIEHVRKFAFELEKRCHHAPFQWFNFYDFWASSQGSNSR